MVFPGRQQQGDVVTNILSALKLDPPLPRKAVEQIQDALQLLRSKKSIGSLGIKNDSDRKRACALLEYIAREEYGIKISMDDLTKQAYVKKKGDFAVFHQVIGNLRDHWKTQTVHNQCGNSVVGGTTTTGMNGTKATDAPQKSSFNLLAVQLGAFVPHSSLMARQAQSLFQQILAFVRTKHYGERKHALQDVQKNYRAYEAACFYLVATQDTFNNNNNNQNRNKSGSSKHAKSVVSSGRNDQTLDLPTFIDATKIFVQSEFETILKFVQSLQEEMDSVKVQSELQNSKVLMGGTASTRKRPRSNTNSTEAQDNNKRSSHNPSGEQLHHRRQTSVKDRTLQPRVDAAKEILELGDQQQFKAMVETETEIDRTQRNNNYSPSFLIWKHRVIQAMLETSMGQEETKEMADKELGQNTSSAEGNTTTWFHSAVTKVLTKQTLA
ncbi:hypothetical protein IV203_020713 [Nitzschia inconspicua]|uniref:Uncharacterized protein n=1 Tax=Nitzschia inconspicua TaxID=303405 RepID=A0A9K3KFH0_9STRA|nr:hypothetical protein IV203_021597 [Nitzschia inconspicua]KAG7342769.1 hypothetical protein IV203_020713 [Nitzschia inconspicua]